MLSQISHAISAQLHLSDVLETIYQQTSRLIDTANFYIALYEQSQGMISFPIAIEGGVRQSWPPRPWSSGLTELLIERRQPLVFSSQDELERRGLPIRYGRAAQSWLGVPIILGHEAIGTICVQSLERKRAFDRRDLKLLVSIASHAAIAIANARTFEQVDAALSSRLDELEALEAVVRDLNATLELPDVLSRLVERAMSVTGADAGLVALYDPSSETLRMMTSKGYPEVPDKDATWPTSRGIIGKVVRTREISFIADVSGDPDYVAGRQATRSQITVPIVRSGEILGALTLESDKSSETTFSSARLRFIRQLADHAALAIWNARTFAEVLEQQQHQRRRSTQLAEVLRVSRALSAHLQLDALAPEIVQAVRASLGFNIAILSLVDQGPPELLRHRASAGLPGELWQRLRDEPTPLQEYQELLRDEFRINQAYFIPHDYAEQGDVRTPMVGSAYAASLVRRTGRQWSPGDRLFVPFHDSSGKLLGLLAVDDPASKRVPSREAISVLEIFANQAAVAIENANLYEASQRLAHTDGLTGLYNQRHFSIALEQEVHQAARYQSSLSLLLFDLDFFKRYNDRYGHLEGNALLRELAQILLESIRLADIVARIGGEEFAVILPETDLTGATELGRRICANVARRSFRNEQVTVSVGAAELQPEMDATGLYAAADAALYRAKEQGRNQVAI